MKELTGLSDMRVPASGSRPPRQTVAVLIGLMAAATTCGAFAATPGAGAASGHIELGYRDVSVAGDDAKYEQHINLDDGPRLTDLAFVLRSLGTQSGLPDSIEVNLTDLGGDPYERIEVRVREYGAYRFAYDRQVSDYVYDDVLVLPEDASVEGSTGGDFRTFDFERVRDVARLDVDASDRLKLHVGFERYDKTGDSTTVLDVEREEFELDQPIDEELQVISAGLRYAWDTFSLSFTERYRQFDYDTRVFLPGFSEGSDPDEPTELDLFFLNQPYDSDTWEHEIGLQARPSERLQLEVTALIADSELDFDATETSQGLDFEGTPFVREVSGGGSVDRDTVLLDLDASYLLTDRVSLTASLRRQELDQDGHSTFDAGGRTDWNIETWGVDLGATAALTAAVSLTLGVATEERDAEFGHGPGLGPRLGESEKTQRDGYYARATYRPDGQLSITVGFEANDIDDPFTLASPTDTERLKLTARYRWLNGIGLAATYQTSELENDNSGWRSQADQLDVRLSYTGKRLSASVGASRVELDREVDQLVGVSDTGSPRQDLFAIDYEANSDFLDGAVSWQASDLVRLGGSYRRYDNDGSFHADRDDSRLFVDLALRQGYSTRLEYRNVDFEEGGIESFDADIIEISVRKSW